jgi:hypothetical protein
MDIRHATRFGPLACLALAMCLAAPAWARDDALHEDAQTCVSFGSRPGSPEYMRCMLAQQRRRDAAPMNAAEMQRNNAEAARNNLETVRRMRCEREAKQDRDNGERPRRCS